MSTPPPRHRRPPGGQAGTGLLGSTVALLAIVVLLLAAAQALLDLSATSAVSAAGWDAARLVASGTVDHRDPGSVAAAERRAAARFGRLLGPTARHAELRWSLDADVVRLAVRVPLPRLLPRTFGGPIGPDDVRRTFVVRLEGVR